MAFFETQFEDSLEENPMFIPFWQKSLYYRESTVLTYPAEPIQKLYCLEFAASKTTFSISRHQHGELAMAKPVSPKGAVMGINRIQGQVLL